MPQPPAEKAKDVGETPFNANTDLPSGELPEIPENAEAKLDTDASAGALDTTCGDSTEQASSGIPKVPWPDAVTTRLTPFLSSEKIEEVKKMFLEGPNPPFVSDAGWAGRLAAKASESGVSDASAVKEGAELRKEDQGKKESNKRGRDRGNRGGRGGRGGKPLREDHRKVLSEARILPIP
jgi:tRNA pseudouridine13 synthase